MVKFSDDEKKEMGGEYFELGLHTVKIMAVVFGETEDKRAYADFTVTDDAEEKEGKARFWFHTSGARKYSFNTIKGIFSHNAADSKRDAIRKKLDGIKDTDELEKLCQQLVGKEAFFEVSEDEVRTYQNEAGETKPSINRDLTGYKPSPKKVKTDVENVQEAIPGAKPVAITSDDKDEDVMADF